jgi:deltex-like protein
MAASSVSSPAAWSWLDDGDRWKPYEGALAASIEAAFGDANRGTVDLHAVSTGARVSGRHSSIYVINFDEMMQYNMSTKFGRPVRRDVPADPAVDGTWEWQDTDSSWKAYHPSACGQIALAHRAGRQGTLLYAGRWNYWVEFSRSVQINQSTHTERPIRHRAGGQHGWMALRGAVQGISSVSARAVSHAAGIVTTLGAALAPQASGSARDRPLPWQLEFRPSTSGSLDLASVTHWTVLAPGEWAAGATDPVMFTELGEDDEVVVRLPCCTAAVPCIFNKSTLEAAFRTQGKCPSCGTAYGLPGPQPAGTMSAKLGAFDCEGHPGVGTIEIDYTFSHGIQLPQHPNPGMPYSGTHRKAYVPNDADGRRALRLLEAAFMQGQTFRIGKSVTTGEENTTVWCIHQKTRTDGGPTRHGYPDPEFLQRLQSECAAANVRGALEI